MLALFKESENHPSTKKKTSGLDLLFLHPQTYKTRREQFLDDNSANLRWKMWSELIDVVTRIAERE